MSNLYKIEMCLEDNKNFERCFKKEDANKVKQSIYAVLGDVSAYYEFFKRSSFSNQTIEFDYPQDFYHRLKEINFKKVDNNSIDISYNSESNEMLLGKSSEYYNYYFRKSLVELTSPKGISYIDEEGKTQWEWFNKFIVDRIVIESDPSIEKPIENEEREEEIAELSTKMISILTPEDVINSFVHGNGDELHRKYEELKEKSKSQTL